MKEGLALVEATQGGRAGPCMGRGDNDEVNFRAGDPGHTRLAGRAGRLDTVATGNDDTRRCLLLYLPPIGVWSAGGGGGYLGGRCVCS